MPRSSRYILAVAGVLGIACQNNTTNVPGSLAPPQNLGYQLDASGDPNTPAGILLVWDDVLSAALASSRVYSRASLSGSFLLRGETSSNTFHDNGVPHLQYAVTAVDVNGAESDFSNTITVDERLQLAAPSSMSSISLNSAVHLDWADNAYLTNPSRFKWYRVYSASYNLDNGQCGTDWARPCRTSFSRRSSPTGCRAVSRARRSAWRGTRASGRRSPGTTRRAPTRATCSSMHSSSSRRRRDSGSGTTPTPTASAMRASWDWCRTATARTSTSGFTRRAIPRCGSCRSSPATACSSTA